MGPPHRYNDTDGGMMNRPRDRGYGDQRYDNQQNNKNSDGRPMHAGRGTRGRGGGANYYPIDIDRNHDRDAGFDQGWRGGRGDRGDRGGMRGRGRRGGYEGHGGYGAHGGQGPPTSSGSGEQANQSYSFNKNETSSGTGNNNNDDDQT